MEAFEETQLSSEVIFNGKVFRITKDSVRLQNGHEALREVVHHSGGAAIVALNERGEVALVRQFRYAAGREVLEIPAGKIEQGEAPEQTALRELREEAGLLAKQFKAFGSVLPTCAYCTEVIYLFLATELSLAEQDLDPDEFLAVFWMDLDEAVESVLRGEIVDAKTIAGLLRAKLLKDRGGI